MGTILAHKPADQTILDFFTAEFPRVNILALDVIGTCAYGAFQDHNNPAIYGVVLTLFQGSGSTNFGYRLNPEDLGPYETDCPAYILDRLSDPPANHYAAEWRAACRAKLETPIPTVSS
jgi:hypothetical protein